MYIFLFTSEIDRLNSSFSLHYCIVSLHIYLGIGRYMSLLHHSLIFHRANDRASKTNWTPQDASSANKECKMLIIFFVLRPQNLIFRWNKKHFGIRLKRVEFDVSSPASRSRCVKSGGWRLSVDSSKRQFSSRLCIPRFGQLLMGLN